MIRKFIAAFVLALFMSSTAFADAVIDWKDNVIRVTGNALGPPHLDKRDSFYKNLARQGARLDAFRNIAELISSMTKTAAYFSDDYLSDDVIKTSMDFEFIPGQVRQTAIKFEEDGVCTVTLEIDILGDVSAMILSPFKNEPKLSFPMPSTNVNLDGTTYTGLIIDCRGLPLNPVMSPAIKNANGQTIYGHQFLSYEKISSNGIVAYGMESSSRAGNNPLLVKAISLSDLNANPVVSVADADKILAANQRDKFLENCAVVLLK